MSSASEYTIHVQLFGSETENDCVFIAQTLKKLGATSIDSQSGGGCDQCQGIELFIQAHTILSLRRILKWLVSEQAHDYGICSVDISFHRGNHFEMYRILSPPDSCHTNIPEITLSI